MSIKTSTTTTERRRTCRMVNKLGDRCTGEVLDPDPKVIAICARHASEVMALISERIGAAR